MRCLLPQRTFFCGGASPDAVPPSPAPSSPDTAAPPPRGPSHVASSSGSILLPRARSLLSSPPPKSLSSLRSLLDGDHHLSKVLPFRRGRPPPPPPSSSAAEAPVWRLAWLPPSRVPGVSSNAFVFLGAHGDEEGKEAAAYWAVHVNEGEGARVGGAGARVGDGGDGPWGSSPSPGTYVRFFLARALLEWHNTENFCGAYGARAVPNFLLKQEGESIAAMSPARRGYTLELIPL